MYEKVINISECKRGVYIFQGVRDGSRHNFGVYEMVACVTVRGYVETTGLPVSPGNI